MKLLAFLLILDVVLGEQMDNDSDGISGICPAECKCFQKKDRYVRCRGWSFPNITANIPDDTNIFVYLASEAEVEFGLVNFSHLPNLTQLTIKSHRDESQLDRSLKFTASDLFVLKPLKSLTNLKLQIGWQMSQPMPELFWYLPRLKELDLGNTRYINYSCLQESFKGLQNNCAISTLILGNTQTLQHLQNGMVFNLSSFLAPLAHCPLKYLDLSYNGLKTIYPGLIRFAPRLQSFSIAHNLVTPLVNSAIFYEVLLHPNLKTVYFHGQGRKQQRDPHEYALSEQPATSSPWLTHSAHTAVQASGHDSPLLHQTPHADNANNLLTANVTNTKPAVFGSFSSNDTGCLHQVKANMCNLYQPYCAEVLQSLRRMSHMEFCLAFQHIFEEAFGGLPCEYFPNITDLIAEESECGGCFIFPTTGNLRKLYLDGIVAYDDALFPIKLFNETKCFHPNKIELLVMSDNYPLGFPEMYKSFYSRVTGFGNLKTANLTQCGLKRLYSNLSATFPKLERLDLSSNELNLDAHHAYPPSSYFIGPPTVKVLRLTGNGLYHTPHDTLQTMTALQELHLDNNRLKDFTMNMSKLPHLFNLNIHGNLIPSFSQNMTAQFDAHAQKLKRRFLINLQGNPLLCTCQEQQFVRWLQTEKNSKLDFIGLSGLQCFTVDSEHVAIVDVNLTYLRWRCLSGVVIASVSAVGGALVLCLLALCCTCVYRKRWWFRYHYYILSRMYRQQQEQQASRRRPHYQYDAFVSYNSRDELWINEILQPKLEDELGLKLCLHERDFPLGSNVYEQISVSIDNSRKTLLILSPNFLASTWCHWEMHHAYERLMACGQDVLLLAILSPMSKVKMSRVLKDLLEKKTYVTWTDDADGQRLFWKKLEQAIRADRLVYDVEDGGLQDLEEGPILRDQDDQQG